MSRLFALLPVVLVAGIYLLLSPILVLATPSPPPGPDYRLNSEGDTWVLVDSSQAEPALPAPQIVQQGGGEERPPSILPAYLPSPDDELGIALDQAREAGPEAALTFVASQPDPHQPLLEAALRDAENDLSALSPPSPSAPAAPRVSLNSGPCTFDTIQAAVNAAANGDTVRVSAGVYTETVNIIGKVVTIAGGYNATCTTLTVGMTQINSNAAGSVVDVTGGSVLTLRNLDLTGGDDFGGGVDLLGSSKVTLDNTDVHGNTAFSGAGIYVGGSSVLTYTNGSTIYNNVATGTGGGAIVYGRLFGYISSSDVYQNSAVDGGGIAVDGGVVILDNADVIANTASNFGGGFYVVHHSVITLTNSVFVGDAVVCCQSAVAGGGIYANASRINLVGAATSVMNNTATNAGGGLYLVNGSRLESIGSRVGNATFAEGGNNSVLGAGMYVITSTVDFSGQIINNIASNSGGGLYATNSAITMTDTTIGGVGANLPNRIGPTGLNGAGMYLIDNTRAVLDNTDILSNTLSNPTIGYGGGIYVRDGSVITMTNSLIARHFAPSTTDGRGAGLYLYSARVTLDNTQVMSNTASSLGGGARLFGTSTLNILDGSSFINNRALNGVGGAIAATNTPHINAINATFQSNFSSGDGGAIYLEAGTLDFTGAFDIRFNSAGGNGGAIAVLGTGDADFSASAGPGSSFIGVNHATGNGGALYVANADPVTLYATGGYLLALNSNLAGGHGGFSYANAGAFFDVYGKVQATSNSSSGNGGVFYLSNGSRIWLDDYFTDMPQILVNSADNGGAIYASHSPRVECDGAEFGFTNNGNKATAGSGGAIFLSGSTMLADNCTFRNNQAQAGNGGAIAAYTSTLTIDSDYPVALGPVSEITDRAGTNAPLATACNPLAQQCSRLYLNTATNSTASNGNGGAIFTNGSTLTLSNTYLHRNTAQRGGAIYQEGATSVGSISNTLVYSNTSALSLGAGIRMAGGAMTLTNDTLANNVGGAGYSPGVVQSHIFNTIIWGNSVAAFGALTEAVCNIDQGGTAGPSTNPLFVSPGAGEDYRLRPGSPAMDACTTGMPRDLLNAPRPMGLRFDMGAFEMHPPIYLPVVVR